MSEKTDVNLAILISAITIVMLSMIIGAVVYNINDRTLMSKNISEAVAKGMDPLSVRCAYNNDTMCMVYAASSKK